MIVGVTVLKLEYCPRCKRLLESSEDVCRECGGEGKEYYVSLHDESHTVGVTWMDEDGVVITVGIEVDKLERLGKYIPEPLLNVLLRAYREAMEEDEEKGILWM